jgi:lipopolysaccharide/colanic/teichoic acid biosynthesis glycosyltransferase
VQTPSSIASKARAQPEATAATTGHGSGAGRFDGVPAAHRADTAAEAVANVRAAEPQPPVSLGSVSSPNRTGRLDHRELRSQVGQLARCRQQRGWKLELLVLAELRALFDTDGGSFDRGAASATLVPEVAGPCGPVVESLSRVDAAIGTRRRASELAQRGLDTAFAIVALVLSAPIVVLSMIAIRLESPGPAIFRQRRMGLHGRPFEIVKLRGMYVDARQRHPELYDYASVPRGDDAPYFFHTEHDPRVTRVGRVLRRYSIDELPNFWNVLRGDMSVVGPRPEIPELAGLYGEALPRLLSVRPGVTSPAKALGRDALSFEETLAIELHYVETRSFLSDLTTIARTAQSVMRGTDAY